MASEDHPEVKINIYQVGKEGEYVVECVKKKVCHCLFLS
mgnify:CR=1 FL=1